MALKILRRGVQAVVPSIKIVSAPGATTASTLIDASGQTLDNFATTTPSGSTVNIFSFKGADGNTYYIQHTTGSATGRNALSCSSSVSAYMP